MPQKPETRWNPETASLQENHIVLWVRRLRRNPNPKFPSDFQAEVLLGRLPDGNGMPEVLVRQAQVTETFWTSVGNLPAFQPGNVWRKGILRGSLLSSKQVFSVHGNQDAVHRVYAKVPDAQDDYIIGFRSFKYAFPGDPMPPIRVA